MGIQTLIEYKLASLNETGDDKLFEKIGKLCLEHKLLNYKTVVVSHSGNPYGGDGGVDAFTLNENYSHYRLACSLNKNWKTKLTHELEHQYRSNYNGLIFFSNQEIKQAESEEIIQNLEKKYDYPIRIFAKSHLVEMIEDIPDCLILLGIPTEQNKLEIEHLAKFNQFGSDKDSICNFVPRRIKKLNDVSAKPSSESVLFSEYINELKNVTVLVSPAGKGKTCALKQICNHILMNSDKFSLPPIYLKVSDYIPGKLCEMIENITSKSPDYKLRDALLFIDGIDEISDIYLEALVRELCSWMGNKSFTRKIVIAGRTNEFSIEALKPLGPVEIILLVEPSSDDITHIINSRISKEEDRNAVWNYLASNFYGANMFFIDKILLFFESKKRIPAALWELLEYVSSYDIRHILRSERDIQLESIGKEAFEVIRFKRNTINIDGQQKSINSFSHRYIIEYLAAKYLASNSVKSILKKTTICDKYILPCMKNTVALTISLISSNKEEKKISRIIESLSTEFYNIDALIKCDSPNLSRDIKMSVIHSATEFILESYDVFSHDKDYCRLFLDPSVKEENIRWLSNQIESKHEYSAQRTLFDIVFALSANNMEDIPRTFTEHIRNKLFVLIDEKDPRNNGSISSILYSLAKLSFCGLFSQEDISNLIRFLDTGYWKNDCFNNTCRIIINCDLIPNISDFKKLNELYFKIEEYSKNNSYAQSVPTQIDNEYTPHYLEFQRTDNYHLLLIKTVEAHPDFLWTVMNQVLDFSRNKNDELFLDELKILETLAKALSEREDLENLDAAHLEVVLNVFMINPYSTNPFRSTLVKNAKELVERLLLSVVAENWDCPRYRLDYRSAFRNFVNELVTNSSLFLDIVSKTSLSQKELEAKIGIVPYIKTQDDSLFSILSDEGKQQALEYIRRTKENKVNTDIHKAIEASSIHSLFHKSSLIQEIANIYRTIGSENITIHEIMRLERKDDYNEYNTDISPLALFYLMEMLRTDRETLSEQEAIIYWDNNTEWKTIILLVNYMNNKNLDYSILNEKELSFIKSWVVKTLNSYPLRNTGDQLRYPHLYISILMNESTIGEQLKKSVLPIKENMKGFISAGIIRELEAGIVNPEDASIDYLESYFSKMEMLAHISENFDSILENRRALMGVGKYLSDNCHTGEIKLFDYSIITKKLLNHIRKHFSETDYDFMTFEPFFDANGISSCSFPEELYLDSLRFNETDHRYENSFASHFLQFHRLHAENEYINKVMKKLFIRSKSVNEKKYLAEMLLSSDHFCNQSFNWYAKLLLSEDQTTIGEVLSHRDSFYCSSLLSLRNLLKLWEKYGSGTNEKSMIIRSIVSNSIANTIVESKFGKIAFYIIMRNLSKLRKHCSSMEIDQVFRLQLRCINEFANRQ